MCGRFTLAVTPEQLHEAFPWLEATNAPLPHFNIAPSQPVAVIANNNKQRLDYFIWGLIPSWAKDPKIGNRMINARAETITEKPSFRTAFRRRRCLIPATGFYEWKAEGDSKHKTPHLIRLKSSEPFAFAGLWENWFSPDGSQILSCTIITTHPNKLMADIHNRMPVILPQSAYQTWLAADEAHPDTLLPLLQPYPDEEMQAYPISKLVNNPANDLPECILPVS
jgi:putative SOS response-associated peptidase YedK